MNRVPPEAPPPDLPASSDREIGRLRWRCRRGMRELDVLLTRYVDDRYGAATAVERQAFRDLLEFQDPLIHAYLLGRQVPSDAVLSALIGQITASSVNDQ